jgi:hypothetical protein
MRRKTSLQDDAMNEAAIVDDARLLWRSLVTRESRGPGDTDNAMRRLARRHGLDYGALWSLRYRPPKAVLAGFYLSLRSAYAAECERQLRLLRHELEITKAKAGPDLNSVRSAEALVGSPEISE